MEINKPQGLGTFSCAIEAWLLHGQKYDEVLLFPIPTHIDEDEILRYDPASVKIPRA
jgi:hypothetical protein